MIDGFALMVEAAKAKAAGNPTSVKISPELFESLKEQERNAKGSAYLDVDKPGCFCGLPVELIEDNDKDFEIV